MFAGVIGSISIGGLVLSTKSIEPKLTRLNPFDGLKRMFSLKSFIELIKAILKFIIIVLATSLFF